MTIKLKTMYTLIYIFMFVESIINPVIFSMGLYRGCFQKRGGKKATLP